MGLGESLLLGLLGMSIVFGILVVINIMIRVLSSAVSVASKKPAA